MAGMGRRYGDRMPEPLDRPTVKTEEKAIIIKLKSLTGLINKLAQSLGFVQPKYKDCHFCRTLVQYKLITCPAVVNIGRKK